MESEAGNSKRRPPWSPYGVALLSVTVAISIRWLLDPLLEQNLALLTLYGSVAVAVWFGGWRPAALAAVAGFMAVNFLFVPPRYAFKFTAVVGATAIGYSLSCGIIIYLGEAMRRARQRAEEHGARLEREIVERQRIEPALRQAHELLDDRAKHLETLVEQRTAKLRETIGELEGFSYSITHDLRAPLRAMQSFSQMLQTDHGGKLDDVDKEYLQRIATAANRMDKLIQDVLIYSSVMRMDLQLEPVDVTKLLRGMLESYPAFQEPKADVRIEGELPAVLGNEAALTQCFSNLLHNAVKFVAPATKPRVRISAQSDGPTVRLWVADNGIGIAPRHVAGIFGLFHRLDSAYEGTGVGLTIVKKAVERMGGRVGVESESGQGSRFWLDLKLAGGETVKNS